MAVLPKSPRPINAGASPKRAAKIQRQNARIVKSNVAKVNSVASKFEFQGVEFEEGLGLSLYEMDFRQYDPLLPHESFRVVRIMIGHNIAK